MPCNVPLHAFCTGQTCGEGTDRISLDLPGVQMQLLAALAGTGKPIILVLVHGRPVTFGPDNHLLDSVEVVLATWIGGEETGRAVWDIVNGHFNPSARLPQAWPRSVGYVGTHVDSRFGPAGLWQGDYQGAGWRDGEASDDLFHFGYGSNTTPDACLALVASLINLV
jgi:beta-glucosidase